MDERYIKVSTPPSWALGKITGGALNGKTDIRPQWRIEALTETYGLCGIGWYVEKPEIHIHEINGGEMSVSMVVALHVKDTETKEWSAPIIGVGGDRVIKKDRNGLHIDEDAYKKCYTDALGKAAAMIGVGADIYRNAPGKYESQNQVMQAANPPTQQPQQVNLYTPKRLEKMLEDRHIDPANFARVMFNKEFNQISEGGVMQTIQKFEAALAEYKKRTPPVEDDIPF